jgi:hypothetical protein
VENNVEAIPSDTCDCWLVVKDNEVTLHPCDPECPVAKEAMVVAEASGKDVQYTYGSSRES